MSSVKNITLDAVEEWTADMLTAIRSTFNSLQHAPFFVVLVCTSDPRSGAAISEPLVLPVLFSSGSPDEIAASVRGIAKTGQAKVALVIGFAKSGEDRALLVTREFNSGYAAWLARVNGKELGEFERQVGFPMGPLGKILAEPTMN